MLTAFNENKMVFTEVPLADASMVYPLTMNVMEDHFDQYAWGLFTPIPNGDKFQWGQFLSNCTFDFFYYKANIDVLNRMTVGKRFNLLSDFIAFVNDTTLNDGSMFQEDCIVKIYAPIGEHLPTINKISGFNHFYSSLVGGNRHNKTHELQGAYLGSRLPQTAYRNFITQVYNYFFGVDITAQYDLDAEGWRASAWVQVDKVRNLYKLPKVGGPQLIEIGSNSMSRCGIDVSSGYTVTPVTLHTKWEIIDSVLFATDSTAGPGFSLYQVNNFAQQSMSSHNASTVIVYLLSWGNLRALYVKPFGGIDNICFPKIPDTFRIEGIVEKPGKRYRFIVPDIPPTTHRFMTGRIQRREFFEGASRCSGVNHRLKKGTGWNVRFYVRDLTTGYVSKLSKCYLHAQYAYTSNIQGIEFSIGYDSV